VEKPNELMYRTALDELGVSADEAMFVDDNIRNCDAAKKLGIKTVLLCRDFKLYLFNKVICKDYRVEKNIRFLVSL
jgi:putative hydrolase of the HAD superfamily